MVWSGVWCARAYCVMKGEKEKFEGVKEEVITRVPIRYLDLPERGLLIFHWHLLWPVLMDAAEYCRM